MTDEQIEKIIKMYKSEPNMEIKFPVFMQDLNETNAQYEKAKKLVQSFEEKVRKRDAKEAEKAEANLSGEDE